MNPPLLVAVNSRFNHTSLSVRALSAYVNEKMPGSVRFAEYTISEPVFDILKDITASGAKLIMFSVYIWNCQIVYQLIAELKKLLPDCVIGAGGPEVSYNTDAVFKKVPELDFICSGEGEETLLKIVRDYYDGKISQLHSEDSSERKVFYPEKLLQTLDSLPFPYPELKASSENEAVDFWGPKADSANRIFYYESSRGCPFSCSYCLSSLDKTVRFKSLNLVFDDLSVFLEKQVSLVKFVDRTFNINEKRYLKIWEFIRDNYNGKTCFHFEIAAEALSDTAISVLQTMPAGSVQLEIGIQTINPASLKAIGRNSDAEMLAAIIRKIPKFIHRHVDLIAGLPEDSLETFAESFNYAISLDADMLQLGFLKILAGTKMQVYADSHNYKKLSIPPYEVLSTPFMSWNDIVFLKDIETLLDVFYNSHHFYYTLKYLFTVKNGKPFSFFSDLVSYSRKKGFLESLHKEDFWFEVLYYYLNENSGSTASELLRFDFMCKEKHSGFPEWYKTQYDKNAHHKALMQHCDMTSTRLAYAYSGFDSFRLNPLTFVSEKTDVLFLYKNHAASLKTASTDERNFIILSEESQ